MSKANQHDKLAVRLGMILTGLFSGKRLHIDELANEHNVTTRTIQRDINQRLLYLPIDSENGWYSLDKVFLQDIYKGRCR